MLSRTFHLAGQSSHNSLINQVKANPAFLMQRFSSIVEDDDRKLKLIKLELSSLQAKGGKVPNPDLLKQIHWDELLDLKTKSARGRYYTYMFLQQKTRENLLVSVVRMLSE